MEKELLQSTQQGGDGQDDQLFLAAYEKKRLGQYAQAAEIFGELNSEFPRDDKSKQHRRVLLEAAQVNYMLGKYERARKCAEQLKELFPDDKEAETLLGKIATAEYRFDVARFHFYKLPDDYAPKFLGLCTVALKERHLLDAQEYLGKAKFLIEPDYPEFVLLWSYVQLLEGKQKEAIAQVRELMTQPPMDTNLLMLAAEIFMTNGSYAEAKKVTVLVNKYAPEHDHSFAVRAYALYAEEEYVLAEKEAYKSIKQNRNNAYALTVIMKCSARKGDYDYAETMGLRILHDTPDYALGHANLGDIYFNRGDYARARIEYNQCRHLMDSLTKGALLRKSRLAFMAGDIDGSVDILRTLIESHHSYYDDAMCDLAICYERLGKTELQNDILERMELRRAMYHRTEMVMEKLGQ